ncbi:Gfo/Idh/MocA family oxidoreductase [Siccirubricoccus phaeus]|uniref:Gfo/Idh/MocA family oxidoreductase n=1 Tax=Siccirubricoccus phaeus TaxID=2595053 RepID=UPI0011F33242|nr:Gfo/Idh/MocA family oxidoreductase [Siccirubricoccus phaeus]
MSGTPGTPGAPLRLAVCGTRFGETYLKALRDGVPGLVLAGLLARGGERSRRLAAALGVPLWLDTREAAAASDAVAVVVRAGAMGGRGTALAEAFLAAGLPVLMEHPLHPVEMVRLLELAARRGVPFHVNSVYPHLPAPRGFIRAVQAWHAGAAPDRPAYAEATTSRQLLYSTLDMLGRALGGLGELWLERGGGHAGQPFTALEGELGGLPFSLRLQSYLDPADLDHHSLVMHRMAVGGAEGSIALASSFGPVLRSRPLYMPGYAESETSLLLPGGEPAAALPFLDAPLLAVEAGAALTGREAVREALPGAVAIALAEFAAAVRGGPAPAGQTPEFLTLLARAWLLAGQKAGAPACRPLRPPPPPAAVGLHAREAVHAGG